MDISTLSDRLPVPDRMKHLPTQGGHVVPWFVAEIDGRFDFRVVGKGAMGDAVKFHRCWVCGGKMGTFKVFPIGPMCAINRTISEPPSHRECAEYAVKACPFLLQRQDDRRLEGLPENVIDPAGCPIKRQPGAVGIWVTKSFEYFRHRGGLLFTMGAPVAVDWYCEGRPATRAEVLESIDSGYPLLEDLARQDGEAAIAELTKLRAAIDCLLPVD